MNRKVGGPAAGRVNRTRGGEPWSPVFVEAIDRDRCTDCGFCIKVCPAGVFQTSADRKVIIARPDDCRGCGVCMKMCKEKALSEAKAGGSAT